MTLTASPSTSAAIDHAAFGDLAAPAETWFTSVDHQRVGRLLTGTAVLVGVVGTTLFALVAGKFDAAVREALSSGDFLGSSPDGGFSFGRMLNAAQTVLPYFVVLPLFLGVATAAVPNLIGGRRMAFPRLQAFVLWGYVVATAFFVASFAVVDGPPAVRLLETAVPSASLGPANKATDLLLGSLMLVTIVTILGAFNVVATVVTQRAAGTRLSDVRPFAFASLVTGGVIMLASPVFLAGLLLLEFDQHFGGNLFASGADRVWTHMLWLNGRPEALLVVLPALGAVVDIVSARVGTRPVGGRAANALLGLYGALTLLAWSVDSWILAHVIQPNSTWQTSLVGVPTGLLLLLTLGTLAGGAKSLRPDGSLLFAVGTVLVIVLAVVNIIVAAVRGVTLPQGTALWSINQAAVVSVAIPIIGLLGAAIEFVPRIRERRAQPAAASLAGLFTVVGFVVFAVAMAAIAYRDDFAKDANALSTVGTVGGVLAAAGIALAGLAVAGSAFSSGASAAAGSEAGN